MSNLEHQQLVRTRNYLDLNNETCDSERQVVLEINKSSLGASREYFLQDDNNNLSDDLLQASDHNCSSPPGQPIDDEIVTEPKLEDTIDTLRDLLSIERQRNRQRRENYQTVQGYLNLLQVDYLRLAQELVDSLELSKKIRNEKDVSIATLESNLRDRDHQIEDLKALTSDIGDLRNNFNQLLDKRVKAGLEQYENQKQVLEQQMVHERVNNSELLQMFQTRLDEQDKSHKVERDSYHSRLKATEHERDLLLTEPQNEVIRLLRDEKMKLVNQLNELEYVNHETGGKYEILKKKYDLLQKDLEFIQHQNEEELNSIQEAHRESKLAHQEVLLDIEDQNEVIQVLRHNLNQAERRAINLLSVLKDKETTWEGLVKQTEIKYEEALVKTKSQIRVLDQKVCDLEIQVEQKQNDLIRNQLEQENQLDSIRSDRDQRINRLMVEKNRIEQTILSIDAKLTSEIERNVRLNEENTRLWRDISKLKEENGKLSINLSRFRALAESRLQELDSICNEAKHRLNQELITGNVTHELEEVQRANQRLETRIKELKKDNQKLLVKLKVNESTLLNITDAIKKEQTKLISEHEKKLESIKQQQVAYDKSHTKYNRYKSKLKKYCEHLTLVHKHLCNPLECGYQMFNDQDLKFCIKKA